MVGQEETGWEMSGSEKELGFRDLPIINLVIELLSHSLYARVITKDTAFLNSQARYLFLGKSLYKLSLSKVSFFLSNSDSRFGHYVQSYKNSTLKQTLFKVWNRCQFLFSICPTVFDLCIFKLHISYMSAFNWVLVFRLFPTLMKFDKLPTH